MVAPLDSLPSDSYIAVLKGKRAELDAVATAPRDKLVPLFEFLESAKVAEKLAKAWGTRNEMVWVQLLNADGLDDATYANQVEEMFSDLRSVVAVVPVLTTTEEPQALAAYGKAVRLAGNGAVLRVDVEDVVDPQMSALADIQVTLDSLGLSASEVYLLLDAGTLSGSAIIQSTVVAQALQALTSMVWKSVVVAFSAFPAALGEVAARSSVTAIPREDAAAFVATRRSTTAEIVYGDYTVGNPLYGGAPFTPIPNIRYAADASWYVHRAEERKNPAPQYRALAQAIVAAPYFSGASFSAGDKQISEVASGNAGPGNATTHLRTAVSRHLNVVLSRLSTLGVP